MYRRPTWFCVFVFLACAFAGKPAYGFPNILEEWRQVYPESRSDNIDNNNGECLLCHASPNGGQPWNAYGWDLRQEIDQAGSTADAIRLIEIDDQDGDSLESFDEIAYGFQPGWRAGNSNTLFFSNGSTSTGNAPPTQINSQSLDLPAAVNNPIPAGFGTNSTNIQLDAIALDFRAPVKAVRAPGINGSLFVVEQAGRIIRVNLTTGEKTLFLDVSASVLNGNSASDERGMLGLAFHPNYQQNGLFYTYQSEPARSSQDNLVDYTSSSVNHRSFVVAYRASDPSCNSAITRVRDLLIFDQPQGNHNAGDLAFGDDGYLYISSGDGGNRNDVGPGHGLTGNGRNTNNILGAILRIDPLGNNAASGKYGIPSDNPFVTGGGAPEIYAHGFRNPYRMSFDATTGELFAADVGQRDIEEVNNVTLGGDYGWNWKEGSFYFYNPTDQSAYISNVPSPNAPANLIDPIGEYDHDEGVSVTGGYVYRGSRISGNQGRYIFADYAGTSFQSGRLLSMETSTGAIEEFNVVGGVNGFITGFGQDADNELYMVIKNGSNQGSLVKLVQNGQSSPPPSAQGESAQCPASDELCVPIKSNNGKLALICL